MFFMTSVEYSEAIFIFFLASGENYLHIFVSKSPLEEPTLPKKHFFSLRGKLFAHICFFMTSGDYFLKTFVSKLPLEKFLRSKNNFFSLRGRYRGQKTIFLGSGGTNNVKKLNF